jgi:hypothetical protein
MNHPSPGGQYRLIVFSSECVSRDDEMLLSDDRSLRCSGT